MDELLASVGSRLRSLTEVVQLRIPWSRGDVVAAAHREGEVLLEQHEEDGTLLSVRLDDISRELLSEFIANSTSGETS